MNRKYDGPLSNFAYNCKLRHYKVDIPSKEMLETALKSFEGTVIAISHDRQGLTRPSTLSRFVTQTPPHF